MITKINTIALALIALAACSKMPLDTPTLEINPQNLSVKAGDTVKFNMSGYADYINFYSGEPGRNYDRIDSFTAAGANPEFQFTSNVQFGTASINNLTVHVSTNFNGIYNAAGINAATWADITSRVILGTSATNVSSGIVNLNDLKVAGKPMYVAFRYRSADAATQKQRQWTISTFQFRTKFPSGQVYTHAASNTDAAFGTISLAGDSANWVAGSSLTHVGLNAALPDDNDWAISRSFDLDRAIDDRSGVVVIKNLALTGLVPKQFIWKYNTAGTYKAVFVIRNANAKNNKEVVKEYSVTVTP